MPIKALAARCGRVQSRKMPYRGSPLRKRRRLYAALLVSLAITGCVRSAGTGSSSPIDKPDIILITIDALRADHLGTYGYPRPTSPSIDALAREAVVVQDAVSQAPYTKASIASLFTGLF